MDTAGPPRTAHLRGLSFWHPDEARPALRAIDLELAPGELLLVCGPSGGGKSTLLRALQGIVPQLTGGELVGEALVLGLDVTRTRPNALAAQGVTLVYQNPLEGFVADRVRDEVAFGPESLGLAPVEIVARTERALADAGLAGLADRSISGLSGGEQQRVAIAGALAMEPRVLLLDEPTAHLDEESAAGIVSLVDRLRRERALTVVITEHRLGLVAPLADRAVVVGDGAILAVGTPREVLAGPDLAECGVPVPRATQAGSRLALRPLPLTPSELAGGLAGRTPARPSAERPTRPSGDLAIRLRAVSFRYDGAATNAIEVVDLAIHRGERVALVGRSGAGKSTLARLALGLLRPHQGDIEIFGGTIATGTDVASRVGLVVQNPMRQLLTESVADEIALGLRHLRPGPRRAQVERMLARFDLSDLRGRHPLSLSEGQRRRVALAATIARAPELLVLDEPTLAQDETQRRALALLVGELAAAGTAILSISHDREFVNDACERVLALEKGRIVADLPLSGTAEGAHALARSGVPLADVPETILALAVQGTRIVARSVDELVAAFG